ncbi:glutathione S-transferase family protein [Ramlibacter sp. USB13]|uniref:glutathione transferase n=1 Tax=Ramlibacter cellulosilyticus TaxID=2764187 RepID=A0A923MQW1_9BURK|nr:glutathione S-transferase family protein [Ramlibacter cellulosilyticus]MBC5783168.1 glutathione S-transferase family protein [Ramlibacter cellulosilyticus]
MELTLVSHALCPYVQRAAIVLAEKGGPFSRRWVDLDAKPDWFLALSPLGKTPVLVADGEAIFESAVICEYVDEVLAPRLHPAEPLQRARHRAWMEFGSSLLSTIWAFYTAADAAALDKQREVLEVRFAQLEQALDPRGPWFAGTAFSIVDAVFAPVFRYFDAFEAVGERGFFDRTPRVRAWRDALAARASVHAAVMPDYPERLRAFLGSRGSELSRRMGGGA